MKEIVPQFTLYSQLLILLEASTSSSSEESWNHVQNHVDNGWLVRPQQEMPAQKYRKDMINVVFFFFLWKRCVCEPNQARSRSLTGKNVLLSNCVWPIIKAFSLLFSLILTTTSQMNWLTLWMPQKFNIEIECRETISQEMLLTGQILSDDFCMLNDFCFSGANSTLSILSIIGFFLINKICICLKCTMFIKNSTQNKWWTGCEEKRTLLIFGGNYGEQYGNSLKN